jgi:hypothetical protein
MLHRLITTLTVPIRVTGFRCLALGGILLAAGFAHATALAQYRFEAWTIDNGLPQNSVSAIHQTRDGYLWLTTLDGLVRYDGVRFTVFNKANTKGIASNRFSTLFEDRQGNLWIGTDDHGLTRYRDGRFTHYAVEAGLPDLWVWAIYGDSASNPVVITQQSVGRWQDGKFIPYVSEDGRSNLRYSHRQRLGGLSFYDEAGLHLFQNGRFTTYPAAASQVIDEVKEIAYNLRPYQLDRLGLSQAIEAMIRQAAGAHGINFSTAIERIDGLLAPEAEINLYRIVQESVNNIVKHAAATEAQVSIRREARGVELIIRDNGQGFIPDAAEPRGFGLSGLAERARILGGKPVIRSAPGQGTTITLNIALETLKDRRHEK